MSNPRPIESIQIKKSGFLNLCPIKIKNQSYAKTYNLENNEEMEERNFSIKNLNSENLYQIPKFKFLACFADGGTGLYDHSIKKWDFYKEQGHSDTIFDCKFSNKNTDLIATASFDGNLNYLHQKILLKLLVKVFVNINLKLRNYQN